MKPGRGSQLNFNLNLDERTKYIIPVMGWDLMRMNNTRNMKFNRIFNPQLSRRLVKRTPSS